MVHYTNCPVCSKPNLAFFLRSKDFLVSGKEFDLCQCSDCNFIFTQDHPDEKDIGKFYQSENYISHNDTKRGLFNTLYHFVRKLMLFKKKNLVKRSTGLQSGSLLDIGSGTGYFASTMKNAGWEVSGVEVNEAARNYSIEKFEIDIKSPDEIKKMPNESFDCITLWHVLEHLENPNNYLDEISRLLKPGGTCLIALPNYQSFDAEYYKQFWAGYDVPRHLWHFNSNTFKKLIDNHGFKFISKALLPFDAFYISILSEKNKGASFIMMRGMITGLKSFFISIFKVERSSSIVYIIRKL